MASSEERRLWALQRWVAVGGERWDVPGEDELAAIAATNALPTSPSPALAAWRPTVEEILRQVRFGVVDPFPNLDEGLQRPSLLVEQSAREDASATGDDALLQFLRERPEIRSIDGLKDLNLRQIVRSGRRSAGELASGMAPVITRNAELIANAIAAASAPSRPVPPAARPEPRAAAPERSPARPAVAEAPARQGSQDPLSGDGFEPYAFLPADEPVQPMRAVVRPDGTVLLQWPAGSDGSLFRLVSTDVNEPYSPDAARLVSATTDTSAADGAPFVHAVRHYQVWRNDGPTRAQAMRSQPVLHAAASVVALVPDVTVSEDSGRVVGRWEAVDGTTAVHVYRVPREAAPSGLGDPRYRINADARNLNGFVDTSAQRGRSYVYQVLGEAPVNGAPRLSQPQNVELSLSARLEPVRDLQFSLHAEGDAPYFDLQWTPPPGGTVVVYRTAEAPEPGVDREPLPASVLEQQARLRLADRLNQPIEVGDRTASMIGVPWPDGWTRAYFTAVVQQGDRVFVGSTIRGASVPPVRSAKLVERVSRQLLTFDWPRGADAMQVFRSRTGVESAIAMQGEPVEITRDDYRELGGFEPSPEPLPRDGCDLHLVAVLFDGGARVQSAPHVVHYPGIRRLRYTSAIKRSVLGRLSAVITIDSPEVPLEAAPPFVLVHNPTRLPLSKNDGEVIAMVRNSDDPGEPAVQIRPSGLGRPQDAGVSWRTDPASWQQIVRSGGGQGARSSTGYIRLFVDLPRENARYVALLDPPIAGLRIPSGVFGG